ncbi:MAG: hypothetical protein C4318_04845 [Acidimicrobiia bacterium]
MDCSRKCWDKRTTQMDRDRPESGKKTAYPMVSLALTDDSVWVLRTRASSAFPNVIAVGGSLLVQSLRSNPSEASG